MSASSDRPGGRFPNPALPRQDFSGYDDVPMTTPPTIPHKSAYSPDAVTRESYGEPANPETFDAGIYAPVREEKPRRRSTAPQVVPPGSVTGRSLTLVVTIMCFLACLTAGAVYLINQSAEAWLKDIASEVTVQIEPKDTTSIDTLIKDVTTFLAGQAGILSVRPLTLDENAKLLEPWLGQSDALKSLPLPRLIALEIDRTSPANLTELAPKLTKQFPGVTLDDHRLWQAQLRAVTRSFALGGLSILLLVAAATTSIIVSATRSAMASNRDIVEVLHFVGATDKFIAREFEKHFLRLGIRAGLVGAALAMAVFLTMPTVMGLLSGGPVTMGEMQHLVGSGTLDAAGYVLLVIVVIVISALCMVTSRVGVYRILSNTP